MRKLFYKMHAELNCLECRPLIINKVMFIICEPSREPYIALIPLTYFTLKFQTPLPR